MVPKIILEAYGIETCDSITPLTSGLIHKTWIVSNGGQQFILQKVNDHVFKNPAHIADNLNMIADYLREHSPTYLFASTIKSKLNQNIVYEQQAGYFRLFPFISGSHSIDVVIAPQQAYDAALQFGKFTRLLSNFKLEQLHITIPDFHNLALRFRHFENALQNGNGKRIKKSESLISGIKRHQFILEIFKRLNNDKKFKSRVTHHDTKISNVLFDSHGKGMCIIDLDTTMPGFFISDFGDMMRTYLSLAGEEEADVNRIELRDDFFLALLQGYLNFMGDQLSAEEKDHIFYAGQFLTYMQCVRFLTDYFNDDVYYGTTYEDQNFVRASNQMQLLSELGKKEKLYKEVISKELQTKTYSFTS